MSWSRRCDVQLGRRDTHASTSGVELVGENVERRGDDQIRSAAARLRQAPSGAGLTIFLMVQDELTPLVETPFENEPLLQ